jgi:hypothetical protein
MPTKKQRRGGQEGWLTGGKLTGAGGKGREANILIKAPTPRAVITERAEPSHTGLGQ